MDNTQIYTNEKYVYKYKSYINILQRMKEILYKRLILILFDKISYSEIDIETDIET